MKSENEDLLLQHLFIPLFKLLNIYSNSSQMKGYCSSSAGLFNIFTSYLSLFFFFFFFFFSFLFHLPDFFVSPPFFFPLLSLSSPFSLFHFFSFSLSRFHQAQLVGLGLEELRRGSRLGGATVDCLGLGQADLTHKIFFSLCEALSWSWPNQKSFLNFPEKQTPPLKNKNGKNTAGDYVLISDQRSETVSWRVLVLFA
jgi:hypothetical protein